MATTNLDTRLSQLQVFRTPEEQKAAIRYLATLLFGGPRQVTVAVNLSCEPFERRIWYHEIPQLLYRNDPVTFEEYSPAKVEEYKNSCRFPRVFDKWRYHPYLHEIIRHLRYEGDRELAVEIYTVGALQKLRITPHPERYWEDVEVVPRDLDDSNEPVYTLPVPVKKIVTDLY